MVQSLVDKKHKPVEILEVGTWNGLRAISLAN